MLLLVAVLVLCWRLRVQYEHDLRGRVWPATAPQGPVTIQPGAEELPALLLLGDSRVAQWDLPRVKGFRTINAGLNGLTSAQMRLRTATLLDQFRPKAVVIEAGINDLKYLGLRPELSSSLITMTKSNLLNVATQCAARGCEVILLEVWPVNRPSPPRLLVWSSAIPKGVAELNSQLRSAEMPDKGVRVVDLFRKAMLSVSPALYRDTLHLSASAYLQLTYALQKELDTSAAVRE